MDLRPGQLDPSSGWLGFICLFVCLFVKILLILGRASEWGERQREREDLKQTLPVECGPSWGAWIPQPPDHNLSWNQGVGAEPAEPPRRPYVSFESKSF